MILLYTVDNSSREQTINTMTSVLKKKKLKQEYILLYCMDTKRVLKFYRTGKVFNSCGVARTVPGLPVGRGSKKRRPSALQEEDSNTFSRCVNTIEENPRDNFNFPIPSVSQQVKGPRGNLYTHEEEPSMTPAISMEDIVDENSTRLVFFNDEKEVHTLYCCFYFKDQLIAVKPELYERVKQESDLNQIIYVAELFGVKEISITKVHVKDKGLTTGASIEANGISQSISLERTDYLSENRTMRLTYDLAKSKCIFYTMKEFTTMLSLLNASEVEELPLAYSDLNRNMDLQHLISARLEASMSSYDIDLKSVRKHSYGISLDSAYLMKCGFKITKHEVQFSHLKIKLDYYNTNDLILSSNLILNRKCFEMITGHPNLLNAYLENFLLRNAPREFIKYKIIRQLEPVKHSEILKKAKVYSDLDLTTGSLLEDLRGLSPTTILTCDEDGLRKIQELYPYIYNFKRDPRLIDHEHTDCYSMRCNNPLCRNYQMKTVQAWILRVYNLHNEKMLMISRNNSREYHGCMERIIINLRHIPTYEKFVKFVTDELTPFVGEEENKLGLLEKTVNDKMQELHDIEECISIRREDLRDTIIRKQELEREGVQV
jgi:hypothetical protein